MWTSCGALEHRGPLFFNAQPKLQAVPALLFLDHTAAQLKYKPNSINEYTLSQSVIPLLWVGGKTDAQLLYSISPR